METRKLPLPRAANSRSLQSSVRSTNRSTALVIAVTLSACSSVRPITGHPIIGGKKAEAVVLAAPFSFQHLLVTYTLPAGRYLPAMEDDSGVYFEAPRKILASEVLTASAFFYDGGLYFRTHGGLPEIDEYVLVRNQPLFVTLPADFAYSLAP